MNKNEINNETKTSHYECFKDPISEVAKRKIIKAQRREDKKM